MRWGVGGGERRLAGAGEVGFGRVNWGLCGGKQRIFQELACGVCGVPAGGEDWERSSGTGMLLAAALPPLGPVRSAPSVDDELRCGGSPNLLPKRPCLCLHQTVKHSSEVERLQQSSLNSDSSAFF